MKKNSYKIKNILKMLNALLIFLIITRSLISPTFLEIKDNTQKIAYSHILENTHKINISKNTEKTVITKTLPIKHLKRLHIEKHLIKIEKQHSPHKTIWLDQTFLDNITIKNILDKNNIIIRKNGIKVSIEKNSEIQFCPFGFKIIKKKDIKIFASNKISAIIALNYLKDILEQENYFTKTYCRDYELINYDFLKKFNTTDLSKKFDKREIYTKNNLRILWLKSKSSCKLKKILNRKPLIIASGLWTNLTSLKKLYTFFANSGYECFKIEITGGPYTDCQKCKNYNFTTILNKMLPEILDKIKLLKPKTNFTYIGHSNGCRSIIYFLNNQSSKPKIINSVIGLGCPGEFKGFNPTIEMLKKNSKKLIDELKLKNKTHITLNDISKILIKIPINRDKNKISLGLFEDYLTAMLTKRNNPGKNIKLDSVFLIAGNIFINNDDIVFIRDSREIINNIKADHKKIKIYPLTHSGLTNNKKVFTDIKTFIENN